MGTRSIDARQRMGVRLRHRVSEDGSERVRVEMVRYVIATADVS